MSYDFNAIEAKWQKYWATKETFKALNKSDAPKYYVLDMFPYPSGAGLHVGHPLGYIASDIYARYKRHQGFNVLHPQGYDSFGLPAEQYAIQTGQHPAVTTQENIARYREQLDKIGFSFDWSREVRTSDPSYYKWTQWIFIELFNSWYDLDADKARPIEDIKLIFAREGNTSVHAACDEDIPSFTAAQWNDCSTKEKDVILLKYRLTYLAKTEVNWCPQLGTVLANDEIVNGVSERGGYPVVRKKMTQWSMRISTYAERLLQGLKTIDWTDSLKDSQRNWIGKSVGAEVTFQVMPYQSSTANLTTHAHEFEIGVFTTRPDTIFGVTFMTLAPEHELVSKITTPEQKEAVDVYVKATAKRSERERMADVKTISGVFTGAYAEHPFTKEPVPIWIGDYVLAGYGTGAVMAVPCGDQRDYDFANHFKGQAGMPEIVNIFKDVDISEEAFSGKEKITIANSDFLNGLDYKEASRVAIETLKVLGQGEGRINYRLRDAVFSRQRYWGEPFPVYYVDGMPQMIDAAHLPIKLPEVEKYLPTETGEPPLGRADIWAWDTEKNNVVGNDRIDHKTVFPLELNTMPGWAGSSWYLFRYMDAGNPDEFASKEALDYWQNVDLYIGGSEHATGHLLYSRFWTKFLKDRGFLSVDEPFKKLINQGMILGEGAFLYKIVYNAEEKLVSAASPIFVPKEWHDAPDQQSKAYNTFTKFKGENELNKEDFDILKIRVDISMVNSSNEISIDAYKNTTIHKDAIFVGLTNEIITNNIYIVGREVEKMSKSKYNVVNPDEICEQYGADTLRLYEMFLGPLEQAKPWNTAGITGVHNFLKKLWKLYHASNKGDQGGVFQTTNENPSKEALKILHKTIKKVQEDIENFSFNTSVSTFMIAVNELTVQKCNSKAILEPLLVLLSPYAPHIAEELWSKLGHDQSISRTAFPEFEEKYMVESTKTYPISFNGKKRFELELSLDLTKDEIEAAVMTHEKTQKQLAGSTPKKIIIVPGKIVNLVG